MELIILAVAVVAAAAIFAFARPKAALPAAPDPRLDTVLQGQATIAEQFRATVAAQAALTAQIDALKEKMGESLAANAQKTGETLGGIQTRLTVIDEAQKNISALSGQVVSLQQVLSNKQSRGAFGQVQMEEIVRDGLPSSLYEFQFTLSNKNRPDCIIRLPGQNALLVIDSKFPLEGFDLLRRAGSEEEKKAALAQVRVAVGKHVADIAEKYLIPGEVQTPAIMFVPSESIYADLHDSFADLIQKAHRTHVIVVSPNILMLAINTIQTVMKDARMREQADLIRKEVGAMLNDVRLLSDRVSKLQSHFNQADADIKNILISTAKITGRAERIEKVELAPPEMKSLS
ncbi:MAG TPA: DNA recombination protein RmuC [Rhizomicrobium sp.]|nr:DNA recombination protein RmuC [Rhizomicrobium sp.]